MAYMARRYDRAYRRGIDNGGFGCRLVCSCVAFNGDYNCNFPTNVFRMAILYFFSGVYDSRFKYAEISEKTNAKEKGSGNEFRTHR